MFVLKTFILCSAWLVLTAAQQYQTTTPVPILKQINKQNDDGSYSFGYEAADGTFKIETKYPNGDVAGKYGYVDQDGKLREISYGAGSKRGFEPQGTGINVPPPTEYDPASNTVNDGQDDGQYREDPRIYEDPKYNSKGRNNQGRQQSFTQYAQPARPAQQQPEPEYQSNNYQSNQYQSNQYQSLHTQATPSNNYQPQPYRAPIQSQPSLFSQAPQTFPQQEYRPQSQVYHQQPQFSYQGYTPNNYQQNYQQPSYQQQNYQNPTQNYNPFAGHPAQNIDPNTGSYTITFTG